MPCEEEKEKLGRKGRKGKLGRKRRKGEEIEGEGRNNGDAGREARLEETFLRQINVVTNVEMKFML